MKKFIKKAKITVVLLAVIAAAIYALINFGTTEEYTKPVAPVIEEVEEVQIDNVSEAQKQLNEAKRLLNDEETKILSEIATREDRLEEIREVRLSFSQAPGQVQ